MRKDDFFYQQYDLSGEIEAEHFKDDFVKSIRRGVIAEFSDLEIAEAAGLLIVEELIAYANDQPYRLQDDDLRELIGMTIAVSQRLGIEFPILPFRDFSSFRAYWLREGMTYTGSYEKRRTYIRQLFAGFDQAITNIHFAIPPSNLITPILGPNDPQWKVIEIELSHLRDNFARATSSQDFCAVGLACVRIQELLGDLVFNPQKHLPEGADTPHRGQTGNRFEMVIDRELAGSDNAKLRSMIRKIIEYSQHLKHSTTPTKQEAAFACDNTIVLVSTIRNVVDPPA